MRTLKIFELGVDELPVNGANIVYFDQSISFGMFEQNYSKEGKVEYLYGDIEGAENLQDALSKGGFIDLSNDTHYDEEQEALSIPLECNGVYLTKGMLWTYEHEYLPVLSPEMFPFQDYEYFSLAIENKWLEVLKSNLNEYTKMNLDFEAPDKLEHIVRFNNKLFYLVWLRHSDKQEWKFHNFHIFDNPEKSFEEIREELPQEY
tara:strand:+ start:221 stop:832 length:612 start_codon:yes stop_codon:yes gene_type:complete